jgi:NADH-quinone oxidoreductase subunit E
MASVVLWKGAHMDSQTLLDVVVIDDEETFTEGCRQTLEMGGYRSAVARDGPLGLDLVRTARPSVVLVDLKMPGMDGLEVLTHLSETSPSIVPIVITGHGTVDSAVESMKIGAFDFLSKPFEPEKLLDSVRRGMSLSGLRKEKEAAKEQAKEIGKAELPVPQDRNDLLLRGLGVLGEAYSIGIDKQDLLAQLSYLESEAKYHAQSLGQVKRKERAILDIRHDLLEADAIMEKYDFQKGALIQVMLDVQEKFHWLPRHILHWIGARLNVPAREVYTIAGFYEAFSLEPRGHHCVQVCTGTACHVRGASELLSRLEVMLNLKPGQTDSRQHFTLETVHCLGCCALAPVVAIDDQYHRDPSRKKLEKIVETFEKQEEVPCRD